MGPNCIAFSTDCNRLVVGDFGRLALYDTSPGPISDNRDAFIELILGLRGDSDGNAVQLTDSEFDQRYSSLANSSTWKLAFREYRRARDERSTLAALAEAEAEHNWFATAFHLKMLAEVHRDPTQFAEQLNSAEAYLANWGEGFMAMRAEQAEDWRAAVKHLEVLIKAFPADQVLADRLKQAKEAQTKSETAK